MEHVDVVLDRLLAKLVELAGQLAQGLLKLQGVGRRFHELGAGFPEITRGGFPVSTGGGGDQRNPPASGGGGGELSSSFQLCTRAIAP